MVDLGGVDTDIANLLDPAVELDVNGVAIDDPEHHAAQDTPGGLSSGDGDEQDQNDGENGRHQAP